MSEMTRDSDDRGEVWKRGLFMLMFFVLYGVAEAVLTMLVLVQFVLVLITGSANQQLLRLGSSLSVYSYQVFSYLTFNSEQQPFPMDDWPQDESGDSPWYENPRHPSGREYTRDPGRDESASSAIDSAADAGSDADR